jgi:uncharacterized protein YgiM (DUF1202 family)
MFIRGRFSRFHAVSVLSGALLALSACQPPSTAADFKPLPGGSFENAGAVIEEPNVFRIVGGQGFTTPFSIDCTKLDASADGWRSALAVGAHRVAIYLPGQPRIYGGVLALCNLHKSATGPSSRSYQLVIPAEKIGDAQDGLVASVAEQVTVNRQPPLNNLQAVSQLLSTVQAVQSGGSSVSQQLLSTPGAVQAQQQQTLITEDFAWMLWFTDRPEVLGVTFRPTGVAAPPPSSPSRGETQRQAPPLSKGASYTVGVALNLRAAPGGSAAVVAHLSPGDAVIASGDQKNGYWSVTTAGGQSGWVAARNLKPN